MCLHTHAHTHEYMPRLVGVGCVAVDVATCWCLCLLLLLLLFFLYCEVIKLNFGSTFTKLDVVNYIVAAAARGGVADAINCI